MKKTAFIHFVTVLVALTGCGEYAGAGGSPGRYYPGAGADAGVGRAPEPTPPGDSFDPPGTNPFVMADHDPFSTFAADVDTASYDIFVRDVEDGLLPAPASVRLEEYVNFFDYDYPAPEPGAEVPFAIDLAAAVHPLGRSLALVRVGIQAEAPPAFRQRPTNLIYLVDVSGSMDAEDKLPLVKAVMRASLDALEPTDTVSIVSYASDTRVRLEPTLVSNRRRIQREIDRLSAGGSTAGSQGIQLAYGQAEAGFIEGGFNHVVLATDGDFNVGISDTNELVDLIRTKRNSGITLTALGFGRGNLNDSMMEAVSNAGNGIYSVISSREQAVRYAREDLLDTVTLVAQDMKIQVEFNPEQVRAYRLLGYENRAIADTDFRNDIVDAGEVGAGHRVTALYEVVLAGGELPQAVGAPDVEMGPPVEGVREIDPGELLLVKVRWKDLGALDTDPAYETSASLTPGDVLAADTAPDPDLLWASAIAAFAEILKNSPYADRGELEAIAAIIDAQADRDDDRARFAPLFHSAVDLLATSTP
ncbi:MAG: DUF3520 domain-containing protein [Deltaproteobacteria bacterium]|nr:DUF3520 domain-containing protein [Deltaproteobacteria bacterium]